MKVIYLTQGKIAIVDDEDFEKLSQYKWFAHNDKNFRLWYVMRKAGSKHLYMHRVVLNVPKDLEIDHINGDGLDNRKSNLRICTRQENTRNKRKGKGTSKYKGVYWNKKVRKWHTQIVVNHRRIYLGLFEDEREAALQYDVFAEKYFGGFAKPNLPNLK